jgi:hypothetical protein
MGGSRGVRGVLAAVLALLASGQAQAPRGAGKDVLELVRQAEAGQDVTARAAALKNRFRNVLGVMNLYNPRPRGGIGFGAKGVGLESRLVDLGEKEMTAAALKKESAELARAARVNLVLAEVVRGFAPAKPVLGRGPKEWQRDVAAMKSASEDLLKALAAGSPRDVRAAGRRINTACNNCHDGKK